MKLLLVLLPSLIIAPAPGPKSKPGPASGDPGITSDPGKTSDAGTTETFTLSLTNKDSKATIQSTKIIVEEAKYGKTDEEVTSKDSQATIKITKIIVEETKDGQTDEYVIDLTERKVFLGNDHKSLNDLEVMDNTKAEKFEVEKMECGAQIIDSCGFIELPANYQPGLDCTWTIPVSKSGVEMEYKFDALEVRLH